tara:strand:- start:1421 stop:2002 length:582 start_codon:yes stop_codon:yes gene_type:complete
MKLNKLLLLSLLAIPLISSKSYARDIVCIGDSVTYANTYVSPGEGYCELIGGINAGVSGNTSTQGLARFKADVLTHNPKQIIIMFGLNDAAYHVPIAEYKSNISRMVRMSGNRKIILMTANPYAIDYARNAELAPYVEAIRAIAGKKHIRLVDNYQTFSELSVREYLPGYYADVLHPNAKGQKIIADKIKGDT